MRICDECTDPMDCGSWATCLRNTNMNVDYAALELRVVAYAMQSPENMERAMNDPRTTFAEALAQLVDEHLPIDGHRAVIDSLSHEVLRVANLKRASDREPE